MQQKLADRPLGSTNVVLSRLATAARLSHSPVEADLKEVQRRFHAAASKPDGPAVPSILKAVLRMSWPSILSKMLGWGSVTGMFGFTSALEGVASAGCLELFPSEFEINLAVKMKWLASVIVSNQPESCSHLSFHHKFGEFSC